MKDITKNEMQVVLTLFKDFSSSYNANSLSKIIGLTSMGTLKILKKLEKEKILRSEQMGKAVFYKLDLTDDYVKNYLIFLLQKEAEQSIPRIKRWVKELRQLQDNADIGIIFGSVLETDDYNDIDLLLVLKQSQNKKINQLLSEIKEINIKKIHAVKQTKGDIKENLKKRDKVVLSIIKKGTVIFGYEKIIEIIKDVTR